MKRRLVALVIGLLVAGTTSTILVATPAGAATNCGTIGNANKFRVDPNPARLTTAGTVIKTFTGRCLAPNAVYLLHEPACNFGGDVTGTTDLSGTFSGISSLSGCTPGTYYTTLTETFGAHKVYLFKERLTSPAPCAAGSVPTIAAVPNNAPRYGGVSVTQTIVGECYAAFAPVTVNFTACGGSAQSPTADAFGRFYLVFSATCASGGSFPMTVTANYPPVGAILATGIQKIDP